MPVIYEDFRRCKHCGYPEFVEEKIYTIPKTLKPRNLVNERLEGATVEYFYRCKKCNKVIDL